MQFFQGHTRKDFTMIHFNEIAARYGIGMLLSTPTPVLGGLLHYSPFSWRMTLPTFQSVATFSAAASYDDERREPH